MKEVELWVLRWWCLGSVFFFFVVVWFFVFFGGKELGCFVGWCLDFSEWERFKVIEEMK